MSSSLPSPQMAEMEALIEIKPELQTRCTNHMRMHLANDPSCLSTLATTDAKTCSDALPAKKAENYGHLPRDGLPRREEVYNTNSMPAVHPR